MRIDTCSYIINSPEIIFMTTHSKSVVSLTAVDALYGEKSRLAIAIANLASIVYTSILGIAKDSIDIQGLFTKLLSKQYYSSQLPAFNGLLNA